LTLSFVASSVACDIYQVGAEGEGNHPGYEGSFAPYIYPKILTYYYKL